MKVKFSKSEQTTILEIARVALADGMIFDSIADKLDISDEEMKKLQEKITEATNKQE